MESWRRRTLKENFPGEEKWEKGFDSDFGGKYDRETGGIKIENFSLVILDSSDLKVPYPKLSGKNHGLASHAIKHAAEFFSIESDFNRFKKKVLDFYDKGEDVYLRTIDKSKKVVTYRVNKNIPNSVQEYIEGMKKTLLDNGYDQTKMKDPEYRNRWQKIQPEVQKKFEEENSNLVKQISSFFLENKPKKLSLKAVQKIGNQMNSALEKIKNLQIKDFLVFLDFYYDMNRLDTIKSFGGAEIIDKYRQIINNIIKRGDSKSDPNQPEKIVTTEPIPGGTAVAIVKKGKISSSMKLKKKAKPEDFFTK